MSREHAARGIGFMILATMIFACVNALVKWLGPTYPTVQLLFFRNAFALFPVLILLWHAGGFSALRTRRPMDHFWRAAVGMVSLACLFYALARMPLATVVAIMFAAPLFVTALSVPLLGEHVGPRRWAAVLVGFVGVLLIVRPGATAMDWALGAAMAAAVMYALIMIFVRRLNRTESPSAIVFYYMASTVLVSGALLPLFWVTPLGWDWAGLVALGILGGSAQICVTMALRNADAAVIAPLDYFSIVWSTLLGFLVWGEIPSSHVWMGVGVVIGSGLYIAHREARFRLPGRGPGTPGP